MAAINPTRITGANFKGYALDLHTIKSEFIGYDSHGNPCFDTKHTELGALLYRLKYKKEKGALDEIVDTASKFIVSKEWALDLIVPVPPSQASREFQPVYEFAKRIGSRLNIRVSLDSVAKQKKTPELKNVSGYTERIKLLKGAFAVNERILGGKRVLLLDDLYRSGATLDVIADTIIKEGEAEKVYALTITRTRRNI